MQFMELLEMQKEGSKTYERRTSHTPDKTLPLNAAILLIPIDFKKLSFEKVVTSRIPFGNFLLHFTYIKTKNPLFHKDVMYLCVAIDGENNANIPEMGPKIQNQQIRPL